MQVAVALDTSARKLDALDAAFRKGRDIVTLLQCLSVRRLVLRTISEIRSEKYKYAESDDFPSLSRLYLRCKKILDRLTSLARYSFLTHLIFDKPAMEWEELVDDLALVSDEEIRSLVQEISHIASTL